MAKGVWVGLDVGVESTSICVVNAAGEVVREAVCPTAVKNVHREISCFKRRKFARIALEAATGLNLARGLRTLGYQVDLYEQRQLTKFLRLRRNKTDAGDAAGIAEAGRLGAGTISKVHLKTLECQSLQSRLTIRRQLIRQRVANVNLLGRQLELYGGRLKSTKPVNLRPVVEAEIQKVFGKARSELRHDLHHLLRRCEGLVRDQHALDCELRQEATDNEVCRLLMGIPGVGPLTALTFYAAICDPHRFRRSADVGAYFGLTPTIRQSGLMSRSGRISKMGNRAARTALATAAKSFLQWSSPDSDLRRWAQQLEERRGRRKARIAVARKLATIMLAMWKNGKAYEPHGR